MPLKQQNNDERRELRELRRRYFEGGCAVKHVESKLESELWNSTQLKDSSRLIVSDDTGCEELVLNAFAAQRKMRLAKAHGAWLKACISRPVQDTACRMSRSSSSSSTGGSGVTRRLLELPVARLLSAPVLVDAEAFSALLVIQDAAFAKLKLDQATTTVEDDSSSESSGSESESSESSSSSESEDEPVEKPAALPPAVPTLWSPEVAEIVEVVCDDERDDHPALLLSPTRELECVSIGEAVALAPVVWREVGDVQRSSSGEDDSEGSSDETRRRRKKNHASFRRRTHNRKAIELYVEEEDNEGLDFFLSCSSFASLVQEEERQEEERPASPRTAAFLSLGDADDYDDYDDYDDDDDDDDYDYAALSAVEDQPPRLLDRLPPANASSSERLPVQGVSELSPSSSRSVMDYEDDTSGPPASLRRPPTYPPPNHNLCSTTTRLLFPKS